ncbi:MAG: glycosyltransferase, partial [Clostridium celatum]|nr:glycosyltransferase [Clostridium celatum]
IAMDEAKILSKPIIATNFSTVKDQINNGIEGIITEMNEEDLAKQIIKLLSDTKLVNSIQKNLKQMDLGTEDQIYKLYDLINSV